MNILRNLEAVFVIAAVVACASTFAAPVSKSSIPAAQTTVGSAKMIKVIVVGKRLSAVQKAAQQR